MKTSAQDNKPFHSLQRIPFNTALELILAGKHAIRVRDNMWRQRAPDYQYKPKYFLVYWTAGSDYEVEVSMGQIGKHDAERVIFYCNCSRIVYAVGTRKKHGEYYWFRPGEGTRNDRR